MIREYMESDRAWAEAYMEEGFGGALQARRGELIDVLALAGFVAETDGRPLAGATLAAIIVSTVILIETDWIRAVIVVGFFLAYQQLENHALQPLVYGRTVQLSPLAVLCAVLIGAELAGVIGALIAIPVAGSLLAIVREVLLFRRQSAIETPPGVDLVLDDPE